jgi:Ca2+-binding RTX toxin-like protein
MTLVQTTPAAGTAVGPGSTVTYLITIDADAAATAGSINNALSVDLGADLTLVAGSIQVTSSVGNDTPVIAADSGSFALGIPNAIAVAAPPITITFQALVAATATNGEVLSPSADITYQNASPDELVYATANRVNNSDSGHPYFYQYDYTTNTVTQFGNPIGPQDSLAFVGTGEVVTTFKAYNSNPGGVGLYNITTGVSTMLVSDLNNGGLDLAISNDHKKVYFTDQDSAGHPSLRVVDLVTKAVSTVWQSSNNNGYTGITFTPDGKLYACYGDNPNNNATSGSSYVVEIDPSNGKILRQHTNISGQGNINLTTGAINTSNPIAGLANGNNLDALRYDPFTGHLFVGNHGGGNNNVYEIDPASLATVHTFTVGAGSTTVDGINASGVIDGLSADGKGRLFVTSIDNAITVLDIDPASATYGKELHAVSTPDVDDTVPVTAFDNFNTAATTTTNVVILVGIGDKVFVDSNANGVQDSGEAGIAGATVKLLATDGVTVIGSTTTDANGAYSFTNIAPGSYKVQFVTPAGYQPSPANQGADDTIDSDASGGITGTYTLAGGQTNNTVDAGFYKPATISGHAFFDNNGNGVQNGGDNNVAGVTVQLLDITGTPIAGKTAITDGSGFYQFTGLPPGSYEVRFTPPPGDAFSPKGIDPNAAVDSIVDRTGTTLPITLTSGETRTDQNAGLVASAPILPKLDADITHDGTVCDGGPGTVNTFHIHVSPDVTATDGAANVHVVLDIPTGLNFKPGSVVVTDPNGGSWTVHETASGFTADLTGTLAVNAVPVTFDFQAITAIGVIAGQVIEPTVDVTYINATQDEIVYATNLNSTKSLYQFNVTTGVRSEITGLAEAQDSLVFASNGSIYYTGSSGARSTIHKFDLVTKADTTIFSSAGKGFNFVGDLTLAPDGHTLVFSATDDRVYTFDTATSTLKALTNVGPLASGIEPSGVTFAPDGFLYVNIQPQSAAASAAGESYILKINPTTGAIVQDSRTVNAALGDGHSFDALTYDAYTGHLFTANRWGGGVWEIDQNTWTVLNKYDTGVNMDGVSSDGKGKIFVENVLNSFHVVDLTKGGVVTQIIAAPGIDDTVPNQFTPTFDTQAKVSTVVCGGSLSGHVFLDQNANGVQALPGDANQAGITIQLLDGAGNPIPGVTATTDGSGFYKFDNLNPGQQYAVKVVPPAGNVFSPKGMDANPALDSIVDPTTGKTAPVTILSEKEVTDQNAGLFVPLKIGDTVFVDQNGNGVQDGGDTPAAGVTVNLLDGINAVKGTLTTDAGGNYLFTGLPPGSYHIQVVKPSGYVFTAADVGNNVGAADTVDSDTNTATGITPTKAYLSGAVDLTIDSGLYQPVTIGNYAFTDNNGDGIQNGGDTPLAGVQVQLVNTVTGAVVATTQTANDGSYLFTVPPGTYKEIWSTPTGMVPTQTGQGTPATDSNVLPDGSTAPITLNSGQSDLTQDGGFYGPVRIGDTVFEDQNGNGIQDAGDTALAAVTVKLLDATNAVKGTLVTDTSGNYLFTGLPPGSSNVQVIKPNGYEFTAANVNGSTPAGDALDSDTDQTTGLTPVKTYGSGAVDLTVDSGLYKPVTIGNYAFTDTNGNAIQDAGDTPLGGVTVKLVNTITGAVVDTQVTAPDGSYLFTVPPGTYKEIWTAPAGNVFTITGQGTAATDSNPNPADGTTTPITLKSGQGDTTQDGGFYVPVKIGDHVFEDQNGNGIQDAADTNLAGVEVDLLNAAGQVVATQNTDAGGNYLFTGLRPGDYKVQFVAPTGYVFTAQSVTGSTPASDSNPNAQGQSALVTYPSGADDRTVDAGLYKPVTIGDRAWVDINKDGLQQALEPGLAGITVKLVDDRTGAVVGTQVTGSTGDYLFTGYKPSEYHVEFVVPAGATVTTPQMGPDAAIDSNPNALGVTLSFSLLSGQTNKTIDAGFVAGGRVSGNVFLDLPPGFCEDDLSADVFQGVRVELVTTTGLVAAITTTDADGNYSFEQVAPGTYIERFTKPDGMVFMQPRVAGTSNPRDSDVYADGMTDVITITATSDIKMINAGLDYLGVGVTGQQPVHLPDGGGAYNYDQTGAYVIGGQGSYTFNGNAGSDYFVGGTGDNVFHTNGSSGSIMVGGQGSNIFEGSPGRDIIIGGCGPNTAQGLGNNGQGLGAAGGGAWNFDLIVGGELNDLYTGSMGRSILIGNEGNDTLDGFGIFVAGPNDGTISSSNGVFSNLKIGDVVKPQNGPSMINYQVGDGVQFIENFQPGRDSIDVWGYGAPTATGMVNGYYALYFGPNSAILLNNYQPQNGQPLTGINYHADQASMPGAFGHFDPLPPVVLAPGQDSFFGSQGDDIVIGTDIPTTYRGNGGDDLMIGGVGNGLFIGGAGNDTMLGGKGNDIFRIGLGSDDVNGDGGNNVVQLNYTKAQTSLVSHSDGSFTLYTLAGEQILKNIQWISYTDQNFHVPGVADAAGQVFFGTAGNDQFNITSANDVIVERIDGGTDTAWVSANGWTLSPEVENGRLTGNATELTGNALANVLVANATKASNVHAGGGNDEIWGGTANGSTLDGGAGDDVIRSGSGIETMIGGTGNDQFVVNNVGDTVVENAGEGTDTAWVGVNGWTVGANIEIVRLFGGASSVAFAGNAQVVSDAGGSSIVAQLGDNVFWGNGGTDTFVGAAGNDIFRAGGGITKMYGGAGNDHYVIKNLGDQAFESANEGYDTAWVAVSGWTVGNNIEVAYLSGGATTLTGNSTGGNLVANSGLASTLTAGAGLTTFWGSDFADTFNIGPAGGTAYGYGGKDSFHFGVAHWGTEEIADFSHAQGDALDFRGSGITAIGQLSITAYADKTLVQHGGDQVILYGVIAPLVSSDFIFS